MNLFKSVFSDSPSSPDSQPASGTTWSFDDLFKTITTKSDSILQTYRRDFHEFSSGLRNETSTIREVASRAVTDLPSSLEIGASVAQESLETVGQAIDDVTSAIFNSTSQFISRGNIKIPNFASNLDDSSSSGKRHDTVLHSRFDMRLRAIQSDLNSYCCEPDDTEDYERWKVEWGGVDERKEEIGRLIDENNVVRDIYYEIVPDKVNRELFWCRYFYRVHKLKLFEEARASLVKRAISRQDEEELSWDINDDDDDAKNDKSIDIKDEGYASFGKGELCVKGLKDAKIDHDGSDREGNVKEKEKIENLNRGDNSDSCEDSDVSVVSSQQLLPEAEEGLEWDEIEDVGSNDGGKGEASAGQTSNASRLEHIRKRLNVEEEDEDLSWDIEDDAPLGKS